MLTDDNMLTLVQGLRRKILALTDVIPALSLDDLLRQVQIIEDNLPQVADVDSELAILREIITSYFADEWETFGWMWVMKWDNGDHKYHLRIEQMTIDDTPLDEIVSLARQDIDDLLDEIYDLVDYHTLHENSILEVKRDVN